MKKYVQLQMSPIMQETSQLSSLYTALQDLRKKLPNGLPGAIINSFLSVNHWLCEYEAREFHCKLYLSHVKTQSPIVSTIRLCRSYLFVSADEEWSQTRIGWRRSICLAEDNEGGTLAIISLRAEDNNFFTSMVRGVPSWVGDVSRDGGEHPINP